MQSLFAINVSLNTLSHIIRQMPDVRTVDGVPMEKARVFADHRAIDAYDMKNVDQITNVARELIINMDESGFADSVDAESERASISKEYSHPSIPIAIDHSIKRSTTVPGISTDGAALKPRIIVSRVTVENELFLWDCHQDEIVFKYQENGVVTVPLYEEWITTVPLPYFEVKRALGTPDNYSRITSSFVRSDLASRPRNFRECQTKLSDAD
jgi:hypothetical protein